MNAASSVTHCVVLPLIGISGGCGKFSAYPKIPQTLNSFTPVFSPGELAHFESCDEELLLQEFLTE